MVVVTTTEGCGRGITRAGLLIEDVVKFCGWGVVVLRENLVIEVVRMTFPKVERGWLVW